jgi:putative glycerol-1-phosphate prenyltransferase
MSLLDIFHSKKKKIALLIDPDQCDNNSLLFKIKLANENLVDFIFLGGSLLSKDNFEKCAEIIKSNSKIPLVLFPGSNNQLSDKADAILYLSLISGRNPDLLIGQHVQSAATIKNMNIEVISTGYILIENGEVSSVQYMSNTMPIPRSKTEIAVNTAIAGEFLGLKTIYLEAGSGAKQSIPLEMIKATKSKISVPLIVGGGIKSAEKALEIFNAGADIIVVGNIVENQPNKLKEICKSINKI